MPINRVFASATFPRVKEDFKFLFDFIKNSYGEYDFSIRDNYFNIYYKGNSLAKVSISRGDKYRVSINKKFFAGSKADNGKFYTLKKSKSKYASIPIHKKDLHSFFQKLTSSHFHPR